MKNGFFFLLMITSIIYILFYTRNDCGVYSMLYIESWNGKKMDVAGGASRIGDYRKYAMGRLLLSPMNEVNTSDFVEKHCVQD